MFVYIYAMFYSKEYLSILLTNILYVFILTLITTLPMNFYQFKNELKLNQSIHLGQCKI